MTSRGSQSHGGQLRQKEHLCAGCGDLTDSAAHIRYARRALLRAAVFDNAVFDGHDHQFSAHRPATAATVVTGVLAEVTPDAIVVRKPDGDQFLALSPGTVTWLGARVSASALRAGDPVIVRRRTRQLVTSGPRADDEPAASIAERIWARIGRVSGEIVEVRGLELLVDTGQRGRELERVVIAEASLRHVQVRFPRLAPGFLIDVIGTRRHGQLIAVTPATAQPPYPAAHPPAPPAGGRVSGPISGTAVWHEPGDEPAGLLGFGYAALDPETEGLPADGSTAPDEGQSCTRLPYLSLGSAVRIRNECADRAAVLPVTSCSASARQFCDRCVACGTSPRARVADLTMAAFVELGGNLEDGCFNATLTLAGVLRGLAGSYWGWCLWLGQVCSR
jgi:hypothetical protein